MAVSVPSPVGPAIGSDQALEQAIEVNRHPLHLKVGVARLHQQSVQLRCRLPRHELKVMVDIQQRVAERTHALMLDQHALSRDGAFLTNAAQHHCLPVYIRHVSRPDNPLFAPQDGQRRLLSLPEGVGSSSPSCAVIGSGRRHRTQVNGIRHAVQCLTFPSGASSRGFPVR